ncbi:MAG: metallophosphoesterase [Planctomycetota bacterium]|nr:metallophosphoesterase [Planctomycetota bacterium]
MEKIWYGSLFFVIAAIVLYAMHRYAWKRLVYDTRLSGRARTWATDATIALAFYIPIAFLLGRKLAPWIASAVSWPAWLWFGWLFYVTVLLLMLELVRYAMMHARRWNAGRSSSADGDATVRIASANPAGATVPAEPLSATLDAPIDAERRVFLARTLAGTALVGATGTTIAGIVSAEGVITTPVVPVALPRLPRALDGFCIAQISDLHVGALVQRRFVERVVERTNALKPDLIVITGDMVDGSVANLARELDGLSKLRARHGIAFVTGNHEYYSGAEEWIAWLRARGVRVLMNERVSIGDAGASFDLAGITDAHAERRLPSHASDIGRALAGRDEERELVLLAHQPKSIEVAEGRGVGLMLSGHTHGGQMWPFGMLVGFVQPYVKGLHRHHDGTLVYVSSGTGFWGPPMRVGNPAEIGSIVLTRGPGEM